MIFHGSVSSSGESEQLGSIGAVTGHWASDLPILGEKRWDHKSEARKVGESSRECHHRKLVSPAEQQPGHWPSAKTGDTGEAIMQVAARITAVALDDEWRCQPIHRPVLTRILHA